MKEESSAEKGQPEDLQAPIEHEPSSQDVRPEGISNEIWSALSTNLLFRDPSGRIPIDFYITRERLETAENPPLNDPLQPE